MDEGNFDRDSLEKLYGIIPDMIEIVSELDFNPVKVAGCDVSYRNKATVSCVVWDTEAEKIAEEEVFESVIPYKYIPGKFALREFPLIKESLGKISSSIDCLIVDGHGIAHPERAGLACFSGVLLEIPTFGCAENILVGEYKNIERKRGKYTDIIYQGEKVGEAVCTKDNTSPIYISPGHLVDFKTSREIALELAIGGKYPEPLRLADVNTRKYWKRIG